MYRKIQADHIFDGYKMLPSDQVLILHTDGMVEELINEADAGDDIEVLKGIVSPGLINCHCHLELSHMKGKIPEHTGLVDFILNVIENRGASAEEIAQAIEIAETEMINNGIVAVGDICNNTSTLQQKLKKRLHYQNFIEVSGFPPEIGEFRFQKIREVYDAFAEHLPHTSIVPHAPYSVSLDLLKRVAAFEGNDILTMHNQETEAENDFFRTRSGAFLDLYQKLNVDIDFFREHQKSSLQHVLPHFPGEKPLILVHNVHTREEDVNFAKSLFQATGGQLFFCLCPNANQYISNELPDVDLLVKSRLNLVFGTDSLASNHQLSIYEEIKTLRAAYPEISLEQMLGWATINGARALKIDDRYGSFEKGKRPGWTLFEKMIFKQFLS